MSLNMYNFKPHLEIWFGVGGNIIKCLWIQRLLWGTTIPVPSQPLDNLQVGIQQSNSAMNGGWIRWPLSFFTAQRSYSSWKAPINAFISECWIITASEEVVCNLGLRRRPQTSFSVIHGPNMGPGRTWKGREHSSLCITSTLFHEDTGIQKKYIDIFNIKHFSNYKINMLPL